MKKKLSVGLVFAIVIMLAAVTALAVISFRDTARQIVVDEQTDGYYKDWPLEKKIALVGALVEQGYVEKTEVIEKLLAGSLSDGKALRLADEAMVAFTKREVTEISFMEIMEAAWGPFGKWTAEEQAWYSQLMVDMNLQNDDHTLYVMPEGPVDEAQAIAIARREIAKGYSVEESVLSKYTVTTSFQVPEFAASGDTQAYWYVEFAAPENMSEAERLFNTFWVFIHPETGELLESVESVLDYRAQSDAFDSQPFFEMSFELFTQAGGLRLGDRTLEQQAEYSKKVRPMIRAIVDSGDLTPLTFDGETYNQIIAETTYMYGVPGDHDIPEKQAFEIAAQAIRNTYGLEETIFANYTRNSRFFDITNPSKPLWRFVFEPHTGVWGDEDVNPQYYLIYRVELDARTGEITQIEEFNSPETGRGGTQAPVENLLKWF